MILIFNEILPSSIFSTLQVVAPTLTSQDMGGLVSPAVVLFSILGGEDMVPLLFKGMWSCHMARLGRWTKSVEHNGDKFDMVS